MIDPLAPSVGDGGSTTDSPIGLASAPPCAIGSVTPINKTGDGPPPSRYTAAELPSPAWHRRPVGPAGQ